jgi:m7GpppX diphosphatase
MHGAIDGKPALLIIERAPFPESHEYLGSVVASLARLRNLGANDVYNWYMARSGGGDNEDSINKNGGDFFADLKINLIYPCTETHIKKYSKQGVRFVEETPAIYKDKIWPYMRAKREQGRLNWVFNILDGKTEVEDVIYRTEPWGHEENREGFLMLPDLNWDRTTLEALHLLALVERRDLWSLRDLKRGHVEWLRHMKERLLAATVATYPTVERDQLKLYVHYQPTYYHLHIHIVHVALEAGATQATGKAIGLDSVIETLAAMRPRPVQGGKDEEEDEAGMADLTMFYTLGEASELWSEVFGPLKRERASQLQ